MTTSPVMFALGQTGADFITDTAAHTGVWGGIYCIVDCTFTTLTSGTLPDGTTKAVTLNGVASSGVLNTMTLKSGMCILGLYTAITLATGQVLAYHN